MRDEKDSGGDPSIYRDKAEVNHLEVETIAETEVCVI